MPQDIEDCVAAMKGKVDNEYAFCNWAKQEGKGPFSHAEGADLDAAAREFKESVRGGIVIPHIHAFSAGHWQGEDYTERDLQDIVDNFRRFSTGPRPLVEPPAVVGHEEEQELLQNTGIPAAGWVVGVEREGPDLFVDVAQVFPQIADLIEAGAYKHVSAEIYPPDNPPEGVPAKGCMLRRVAFLGGQLPHVKSLADLPMPVRRHAERRRARLTHLHPTRRVWQNTSRTWACFSEVRTMAEDAVQQVASAAIMQQFPGLPADLIESFTPEQMQMIAAAIAPDATEGGGEGDMKMQDMPSREQMIADLVALGEDEAALQAMTDADLMQLWQEKKGATMAEPNRASTAAPVTVDETLPPLGMTRQEAQERYGQRQPTKVTTTQQFSEADLERIVTRVANKIVAPLRQDVARERSVRQSREKEEWHGLIRTFCERLVKEGRLSPAQVEIGKDGKPVGPVAKALHAADAVRKFSDGKTALQLQMEALEALPARRFSEQVQDPVKQAANQMSQERRDYLLSLTGRGKAVLAKEETGKQNARLFAEALAGVVKQVSGNGHAG